MTVYTLAGLLLASTRLGSNVLVHVDDLVTFIERVSWDPLRIQIDAVNSAWTAQTCPGVNSSLTKA